MRIRGRGLLPSTSYHILTRSHRLSSQNFYKETLRVRKGKCDTMLVVAPSSSYPRRLRKDRKGRFDRGSNSPPQREGKNSKSATNGDKAGGWKEEESIGLEDNIDDDEDDDEDADIAQRPLKLLPLDMISSSSLPIKEKLSNGATNGISCKPRMKRRSKLISKVLEEQQQKKQMVTKTAQQQAKQHESSHENIPVLPKRQRTNSFHQKQLQEGQSCELMGSNMRSLQDLPTINGRVKNHHAIRRIERVERRARKGPCFKSLQQIINEDHLQYDVKMKRSWRGRS